MEVTKNLPTHHSLHRHLRQFSSIDKYPFLAVTPKILEYASQQRYLKRLQFLKAITDQEKKRMKNTSFFF